MTAPIVALTLAGTIGCAVAIIHGVLTQRFLVQPVERIAGANLSRPARRLIPALLQFSTFNWFVGGVALIVSALALGSETRTVVGVLVGSSYLFGAIGNAWATRGRHPGWLLYAVAVVLIAYGVRA